MQDFSESRPIVMQDYVHRCYPYPRKRNLEKKRMWQSKSSGEGWQASRNAVRGVLWLRLRRRGAATLGNATVTPGDQDLAETLKLPIASLNFTSCRILFHKLMRIEEHDEVGDTRWSKRDIKSNRSPRRHICAQARTSGPSPNVSQTY